MPETILQPGVPAAPDAPIDIFGPPSGTGSIPVEPDITPGEPVEEETIGTGDGYGIIRFLDEISTADVLVTEDGFGDLVQVDGIDTFEDFGIVGPVYRENLNLRIEYRRRGKTLSDEQPFEIPDRYTTYVRHYVLARALEREGPGQDLKLSAHFDARFQAGIARMLKRKNAMNYARTYVMGGSSSVRGQKPPRPRLPYQYGTVVR